MEACLSNLKSEFKSKCLFIEDIPVCISGFAKFCVLLYYSRIQNSYQWHIQQLESSPGN